MTEDRMLNLLERLNQKVETLKWEYDDSTGGYFVKIGKHFAEIRSVDRDDAHPFALVVIDENERVVERVGSNDHDLSVKDRLLLQRLYKAARRKGSKIDEVLDQMIEGLE